MTFGADRIRARRRWSAAVAVLALLAPLASLHAAESGLPPGLATPAKATAMPAFELPTATGTSLRSQSLRGQVVVIRFWASW